MQSHSQARTLVAEARYGSPQLYVGVPCVFDVTDDDTTHNESSLDYVHVLSA